MWHMLQTYKTTVYVWLTRMSDKQIALKLIAQYACICMSACLLGCDAAPLGKKFPVQYRKNSSLTAWLWKLRHYSLFKSSGTTQTTTYHNIPEDFSLKHWNTFLFLNKQTTLLCICGLTQQNKKHNTYNSLKYTSCHIQHLKVCAFPTEGIHTFVQFSE